jgi:hypothetical protein
MDPLLPFLEIVTAWQHQLPITPPPRHVAVATQPPFEDDPRWDCRVHGDRTCGLPILDGWLTPDPLYQRMVVSFDENGRAEGYWWISTNS